MPHLTLEFSSNIIEKNDMPILFKRCHETLTHLLPTDLEHCKSRAIECKNFYIGHGDKDNAFVHVNLEVMPGRTVDTLKIVNQEIIKLLQNHFLKSLETLKLQITVSISELPVCYQKITNATCLTQFVDRTRTGSK